MKRCNFGIRSKQYKKELLSGLKLNGVLPLMVLDGVSEGRFLVGLRNLCGLIELTVTRHKRLL